VPRREVLDVDVVAQCGAVGGVVVATEDPQLLELADRDLSDEGHEVVRDPLRVLPDRPRRVRPDRVEVAQQGNPPARLGHGDIAQHLLDHHLRPPVGVGGRGGHVLAHRHRRVGAVDRCGRGEDQLVDVVAPHGPHEREGRPEVVLVVLQRLRDALADSLEAGEVDDGVDLLVREELFRLLAVAQVEGVDGQVLAGQGLEPVDDRRLGVGEAVDDDDLVARSHELDDGVGADVAGAAGDENAHAHTVLARFAQRLRAMSASMKTVVMSCGSLAT